MVVFTYPLKFPPEQPRTSRHKIRDNHHFGKQSISKQAKELDNELRLLRAKNCVITSDLRAYKDGTGLYANASASDAGIAIYFELKGKSKCMACDKWSRPEHNLRALVLSIKAIRGLERWGGSEFLDGLFTGFTALPDESMIVHPKYFDSCHSRDELRERYIRLCKELHPDTGGDADEFMEMKRQYNEFIKGL